MKNTVLSLMAHPDDAEFLCGGTLALLADLGWEVHIASATPGDCGTVSLKPDEIAAIRREEGARAARVIGGTFHCLERRDLRVFYDADTVREATGLLRRVRPRILITHSPADYMVDHEQISMVARAAAFNAAVPNAPSPPGLEATEGIPHVYYADPAEGKDPFGNRVMPSVLIDVGSKMDVKLEMVVCHASQREWLHEHHGMDEYVETVRRWTREQGKLARCEYAEGFRQHRGHAYPQDDLLALTLGKKAILRLTQRKTKRTPP